MAGDIRYITYTALMILIIVTLYVLIKRKKGNREAKNFLLISIPFFMLIQLYFWNINVNVYVKSFLFADKVFECEHEDELKNLSLPLPKRTVFLGKEDACSPFYNTYVQDKVFKSFYEDELSRMKQRGKITNYKYFESKEGGGRFILNLPKGSEINIFIKETKSLRKLLKINVKSIKGT